MKWKEWAFIIFLVVGFIFCWSEYSLPEDKKAEPAKPPALTESQQQQLSIAQRDWIIADQALELARVRSEDAHNAFFARCEQFKKEDGYPPDAVCDPKSVTIQMPPPKPAEPAKTEPPKPAEKPKAEPAKK